MTENEVNSASAYFNANWQRYQDSVKRDTLHHKEMFSLLNKFISEHFQERSFTLVDAGCGDAGSIFPVLQDKNITKYIGIDAASDILKLAAVNLKQVKCQAEFICDDMLKAIAQLKEPVDIIFTSYAVHHLSSDQKTAFIQACKDKLNPHGFFLMVDGVLAPQQNRNEWLNALKNRMQTVNPDITSDELAFRMQHPAADDFPESIVTFRNIAEVQGWKNFQVLVDKNIFAFLAFAK